MIKKFKQLVHRLFPIWRPQPFHIKVNEEISRILSEELAKAIDKEILKDLFSQK